MDSRLRLESVFFVVALDFEYLAKTYFPRSLEKQSHWKFAGSRPWYQVARDGDMFQSRRLSRLLYYYCHPVHIRRALDRISEGQELTPLEMADIVKIDLLRWQSSADRVLGSTGKTLSVEVWSLHFFIPCRSLARTRCLERISALMSGIEPEARILENRIRGGRNEPTFIPAILTQPQLRVLSAFNPLRAIRLDSRCVLSKGEEGDPSRGWTCSRYVLDPGQPRMQRSECLTAAWMLRFLT